MIYLPSIVLKKRSRQILLWCGDGCSPVLKDLTDDELNLENRVAVGMQHNVD